MAEGDTREKILIVDDNRQNIEQLMGLFKDDYRIAAAVDAQRALKVAQSDSPPDIILSDIIMPDVDGYELCSLLKQDERTKSIPLIFVTAVSEVMDETRGFALGAVDYITKPFHPPMVKARVAMHLNLKRKQELLEQFAFIDALTEIPNRRRLDEVLEQEWNRAKRSQQPLSALFIDVDDLPCAGDNEHGWIRAFCETCNRCVDKCPGGAVRREPEILADGTEAFIEREKCAPWFSDGCSVCIACCPFTGGHHDKLKAAWDRRHPDG